MEADQVRANAERLRIAQAQIGETLKFRSKSPAGRAAWEAACTHFHAYFDESFFPGGDAAWSGLLAGEKDSIELALIFLEVDQVTFRSGYHKEIVWDRLKRLRLTSEQQGRLEEIALLYLHRRVRREFWRMVNFMRQRGSASFWQGVEIIAESGQQSCGRKARWMLLARRNVPVRRLIGAELFRTRYEPNYLPQLDFPSSG
ncbi:hypothetical protein F2P44_33430 [Massilia sp. CCM 8695]|uniref:Uncharacterized protein n=1 Tax=Massilia frigida TaxID=2609281 RepID=A0ABX0NKI9_9BURK|nr:hypothetical protein [Massilia frigida]NHZ84121.1 hypothetical protein [Massilia frigida]